MQIFNKLSYSTIALSNKRRTVALHALHLNSISYHMRMHKAGIKYKAWSAHKV